MKPEDLKMICVKGKNEKVHTVYLEPIPLIVVQVNDLQDAPKELAKSLEAFLKYQMKEGNYIVRELGF